LKTGADLSAGVFKMRCGKGYPATAGQPRKISKKDSGGCPKDRRAGRFRRKIPKEIEKQGENQNEYIIKMDQRFSAGT
jgi:hypothetical protein